MYREITRNIQVTVEPRYLEHESRPEVTGAGVVGEQPVLEPGQRFEYTSGCPLSTPSGLMVGTYQMVSETGELFSVQIPAFSLDSPHVRRIVN
jgi:ApaG protein